MTGELLRTVPVPASKVEVHNPHEKSLKIKTAAIGIGALLGFSYLIYDYLKNPEFKASITGNLKPVFQSLHENSTNENIAIVYKGGGMKGQATAEFLLSLVENGLLENASIFLAASVGSTFPLFDRSPEDIRRGMDTFLALAENRSERFIDFRRALRGEELLHTELLAKELKERSNGGIVDLEKREVYIALTNFLNGKTEIVSLRKIKTHLEAIIASCCAPGATKSRLVEGLPDEYIDGDLGGDINLIRYVVEELKATRILVLATGDEGIPHKFRDFIREIFYVHAILPLLPLPKHIKDVMANKRKSEQEEWDYALNGTPDGVEVAYVHLNTQRKLTMLTTRRRILQHIGENSYAFMNKVISHFIQTEC